MSLMVVNESLVKRFLGPAECLIAVEEGFRLLQRGEVSCAHKQARYQAEGASIHLYFASVRGFGMGVKVLHTHEMNPARGRPYIHATMILIDPNSGRPEAILDGGYLTAMRTAAAAALSTHYLARPDSKVLGILGTGLQARTHLLCHMAIHPFSSIVVWGRTHERLREYLDEMALEINVPIHARRSADEVCAEADVISCTTRANTPLFSSQAIRPGTHIIVTGPMGSEGSEIPLDLLQRGRLFVDSEEGFKERWSRAPAPAIVAELGDVILSMAEGRVNPEELTLFKPVGMAFEDVVSARIVIDRASQSAVAQTIPW